MRSRWAYTLPLVFVFVLSQTVLAQSSDVTGEWDITLTTPMGPRDFKVSFKQNGENLTGVIKRESGELAFEGSVTGRQIKFSYKITREGEQFQITMTGAVEGDSIKGQADFGGMAQGDWSAKRAGAVAALPSAAQKPASARGGIAGDWDMSINSPQGTTNASATFKQDGEKLSGILKSPRGQLPVAGTIQGSDLKFSFSIKYEGNDLPITMTGKLEGDLMKGGADFGGLAQGDWSAKRSEAAAPTSPISPPSGGITGDWQLAINSPQGTTAASATFKQEGEKLSGALKSPMGEVPVQGAIQGPDLKFQFTIKYQGSDLPITMSGRLDGDSIKGGADFGGLAQGDWTGKRGTGGSAAPAGTASTPDRDGKVDITGTWLFQMETPMGTSTPTVVFKQEGETVTGIFKGRMGEVRLGGTVRGNAISFSIKVSFQGMEGVIDFAGTLDKDSMTGTAKMGEMGEAKFTAKKQ